MSFPIISKTGRKRQQVFTHDFWALEETNLSWKKIGVMANRGPMLTLWAVAAEVSLTTLYLADSAKIGKGRIPHFTYK